LLYALPGKGGRRRVKIERIFNKYIEFLKEMVEEGGSVGGGGINN